MSQFIDVGWTCGRKKIDLLKNVGKLHGYVAHW